MEWIEKLIQIINDYFSRDENKIIKELRSKLDTKKEAINDLTQENKELSTELEEELELVNELQQEINLLKQELETKESVELEDYWNNKIPKSNIYYHARSKESPQSVREFLNKNNNDILVFTNDISNDSMAELCLKWVHYNIDYTQKRDKENEGEYWQYANETNEYRNGDCEDGAILMANMMIASGIPYWRVRVNAGMVNGGGHAYVTYLKEEDDEWYVMDWCYWYDSNGKLWKDAEKYFGIWFSFNTKYAFKKSELDRE